MTFEGDSYDANNQRNGENQSHDLYDPHLNSLREFSINTNRMGPPPRGLFDDI